MASFTAVVFFILSVGVVLGTPRVRGDPVYNSRDQTAAGGDPRNINPGPLTIQLPQDAIQSLLNDPRYASLIRQNQNQGAKLVADSKPQLRPNESQRKKQQQQQQQQHHFRPQPFASQPQQQSHRLRPARPNTNNNNMQSQMEHLVRATTTSGAQLINVSPPLPSILARLPDNATLIRPNIVDTFRCGSRIYGYYADVDNECQLFHVCLPMGQLYPELYSSTVVYQFTFICPLNQVFSQDVLTCTHQSEAIPCESSEAVAWINQNFFKWVVDQVDGSKRYAHVNEGRDVPAVSPPTPSVKK